MFSHPRFLRHVLIADAVASGAVGALMIAGAGFLSGLLAIPGGLLFEAGLMAPNAPGYHRDASLT